MSMITVPLSIEIENDDMKSLVTILLLTFLISSCSEGGTNSTAPNDGPFPIVPVLSTTPVDDDNTQFGALSDLIGSVRVDYSFTGTEPVLGIRLEFTADSFSLIDGGSGFLFSEADVFSVPSPGAEPIRGSTTSLGCGYIEDITQFFCILSAGGDLETFFVFDRVSIGSARGSFEFCGTVDSAICRTALFSAPDGAASITVSSPIAVSSIDDRASAFEVDLLPYLEYLKQGSSDDVFTAPASSLHVEAISSIASSLRNSLTTR